MVQLVCSCLNVRLHVQESPESLVGGIPDLTPSERQHPFFLKGACPVTLSLGGITEGQRLLVRSCRVGSWTVLECLNCRLLTHATRGHSGGSNVAASTLLISDANKIQMLQKCDGYSPAFNLVLPPSSTLDNQPSSPPLSPTANFPPSERSPETEAALRDVQEQLARFLKKAQAQVESNILSYTKQQQAALQTLTARARRDRHTVLQLINNVQANMDPQGEDDLLDFDMDGGRGSRQQEQHQLGSGSGDGFGSVVQPEDLDDDLMGAAEDPSAGLPPLVSLKGRGPTQPMSMNLHHHGAQGITAGMHNMRLSSSVAIPRVKQLQAGSRVAHSLDAEGLFDMEGMVDNGSASTSMAPYHSDEGEESDDSTVGEGCHIPGSHNSLRDLAKSVPVCVPMWPADRPKPLPDDKVLERPSDNDQIAASIRALARSVHTTSVDLFGELPRPRQPL